MVVAGGTVAVIDVLEAGVVFVDFMGVDEVDIEEVNNVKIVVDVFIIDDVVVVGGAI